MMLMPLSVTGGTDVPGVVIEIDEIQDVTVATEIETVAEIEIETGIETAAVSIS